MNKDTKDTVVTTVREGVLQTCVFAACFIWTGSLNALIAYGLWKWLHWLDGK